MRYIDPDGMQAIDVEGSGKGQEHNFYNSKKGNQQDEAGFFDKVGYEVPNFMPLYREFIHYIATSSDPPKRGEGTKSGALETTNPTTGLPTGDVLSIVLEEVLIVNNYKAPEASNDVRLKVVEPNVQNVLNVLGNTMAVIDLVRNSEIGNFVRSGRPAIGSVSSFLKGAGNVLGGVGIAYGVYQFANNEISALEFSVDTFVGGAAIITSIVAAPAVATAVGVGALIYFGGKAIYEYSSGKTLFDKPKP